MTPRARIACTTAAVLTAAAGASRATDLPCGDERTSTVSFISFQSPNIAVTPPTLLTIKGKLAVPAATSDFRCDLGWGVGANGKRPAVLILHGSSGVDSRGDFYERALNAAGITTLQIDMWEARGVTGIANRPGLPVLTYPDAFSALAFLAVQPGVDAQRIGVLGFSWGGVMALGTAEQLYAGQFGGGRKFKAHVANYPVCYGANNPGLVAPFGVTPAQAGTQFLHLTGAPVLIQIGSNDSYDNGTAHCTALAQAVNPGNNNVVKVNTYPGAYHAWDRLMIPVTAPDPFANEGSYVATGVVPIVTIVPDVAQAYTSRDRVVRFFRGSL